VLTLTEENLTETHEHEEFNSYIQGDLFEANSFAESTQVIPEDLSVDDLFGNTADAFAEFENSGMCTCGCGGDGQKPVCK